MKHEKRKRISRIILNAVAIISSVILICGTSEFFYSTGRYLYDTIELKLAGMDYSWTENLNEEIIKNRIQKEVKENDIYKWSFTCSQTVTGETIRSAMLVMMFAMTAVSTYIAIYCVNEWVKIFFSFLEGKIKKWCLLRKIICELEIAIIFLYCIRK